MIKQKQNFKYFLFLFFFLCSVKGFAANYYWVGGSGNWSDINHWRTSSGGSGIPFVVPGLTDDVYFDANSGFTASSKTVTVNVPANMRNITFSGSAVAPVLNSASTANPINIYGSSEWQSGMTVNSVYLYYRNANIAKTIKSNGVPITGNDDVYFEDETSISLLDDFSAAGRLNHMAGTFNTNNHKVSVRSYAGNTGGKPRTLNLGSSDFYITGTMYDGDFSADSSYLTLNAGTSHIRFTGVIGYPKVKPYAGQHYYNISFEKAKLEGNLGYVQSGKVYYNRITMNGNGKLIKDNEIKELILSEGKTYSLASSSTQTITGKLSAHIPDCGEKITISSSTAGTPANLVAASGVTIDVSGVILQDIKASGGAVFKALESLDSGNNAGWVFPAVTGKTLYWVGGNGNWNDRAHWSSTSGGTGGYCVPGPLDDVYFNADSGFTSSGKTVTVNSSAYMHNITFSGSGTAPFLNSTTNPINIYGSSEWQTGMSVSAVYIYYRNNNAPKTVKSNGVPVNGSVFFEEETSVSLMDDLSVSSTITHSAGTLATLNHKVSMKNYSGDTGSKPRTLNLGSSDFYITGTMYDGDFSADSSYLTLNAGTSHIRFTGVLGYPKVKPYAGQHYYNISFEKAELEGNLGYVQSGKVYYNRITMNGNGKLIKDNEIKELILSEGKTYSLASSSTQTITGKLSAHIPDCGEKITISSSTAGTPANLVAASGVTIDVSGVILQDIKASGGAVFKALESLDSGNNAGWVFPAVTGKILYWVGGNGNWNDRAHWSSTSGGTGGYCVPGPLDDVYFNADSGFTSSGKTVTVNVPAHMHNITFSGSGTAPFLNSASTTNPINIYGSSEWQTGMSVSAVYIYYRNNNAPKTVKSNGVPVNGSVFFEEETSVSLMDDLSVSSTITHSAGTLATLNHKVSMKNYSGDTGSKARVLKLGSSDVYITGPLNEGDFEAASSNMTLDAGTSHIHFTGVTGSPKLKAYSGQHYYNISFEKPGLEGTLEGSQTGSVYYNNVIFKGNGKLNGGNEIKELVLTGAKKYTLQAGKIQKITDKLYANGSSCYKLEMVSSVPGAKALLNVMAGATNFDFANIKDINSSGIPLHFGSKSSDLGNNDNISFSAYDPGVFSGFAGQNWSCTQFNNADPASYTLSSAGFFGNPTVKYEWTKLNDPAHTGIISTGESLDMRSYGLGTYHLKVVYSTAGPDESCTLEESVIVGSCIPSMINPGLPIRNY